VKPKEAKPRLAVKFFRQEASLSEPVREWLKSLPESERKVIGEDIKAAQFGWPLGLPLVDHVGGQIWEVRSKLDDRIARVLFAIDDSTMVLLHGFIKKDRRTPKSELDLARIRLKLFGARK